MTRPAAAMPHTGSKPSKLAIEQAAASLRAGDPAEAEWILRQRILEDPRDIEVLAKLADIVGAQGRSLEAIMLIKRAVHVAPDAHRARLALAQHLQQRGEFHAALKEVEALSGPPREGFEARALEAALLGHLGMHGPQLVLYQRLATDFPADAALWMRYGNALKTVGRRDEAVTALRRAIRIRPTFGEAWWSLANLKTFRFENRDLAAMRKALRGKLNGADSLHFHFALGKALEDRDDFHGSFEHYAAGNRIRSAGLAAGQTAVTPRVDATIATFGQPLFDRFAGSGDMARDPIFIVGLQRSGSTLIEQILASHPMIEGTSELTVMEQIWERLAFDGAVRRNPFAHLAGLDRSALAGLGAEYLERTRPFRLTNRPMFVDKLPANWMNAGLIRLILPNARIIDARRHPMACGFSNFKQHYATGVTFAYSQEWIGLFYRDYLRLMSHMDRVQPGAIHHVLNERLIDDPEGEVRRLLEHVGVPFDPACLEFHRNERAVHSASSEQVRRPINRDGIDYWLRYEPWLGPLKQALGPALDEWDRFSG